MDWVFTPSWDFSELGLDDFDVMGKKKNMEVFSTSDELMSEKRHSKTSCFVSGSSGKPTRELPASCLVDGCRADLRGCRDYHRRHRVCETHSKTPVVTIAGREQRFCQQCSRFHSLGEFDEVKRSCRKRLDGHNRRRRKSRNESMYFNYRSFLSNHQGAKLLNFGGGLDKETTNQKLYSVKQSTREKRFPFLLGVDDKVNGLFSEPKGVLSLLSNSNQTIHHGSVTGPLNNMVQFSGSVNQHLGQAGQNSGHMNDQLFGMIQFRSTEGLLDNEAAQVVSFSWD